MLTIEMSSSVFVLIGALAISGLISFIDYVFGMIFWLIFWINDYFSFRASCKCFRAISKYEAKIKGNRIYADLYAHQFFSDAIILRYAISGIEYEYVPGVGFEPVK